VDPCRSPSVLLRHPSHQVLDLPADGWSSSPPRSLGAPFPEERKARAVPRDHRLRLHDHERLAPPRPHLTQKDPDQAIWESDRRAPSRPNGGELMSEGKNLDHRSARRTKRNGSVVKTTHRRRNMRVREPARRSRKGQRLPTQPTFGEPHPSDPAAGPLAKALAFFRPSSRRQVCRRPTPQALTSGRILGTVHAGKSAGGSPSCPLQSSDLLSSSRPRGLLRQRRRPASASATRVPTRAEP